MYGGREMKKYIVGIDIGGTNIKAGILSKEGEILLNDSIKTEADRGADYVLEKIKDLIFEMIEKLSINKEEVIGVGMGIPGPTNTDTGVVNFCPNMIGWKNYRAAEVLSAKTGFEVKIGNDVNVITLGEMWKGAAVGYKNVLGITLGTGIGGGLIVNGKLMSGFTGAAGEVGHIKVEKNGKLCGCGQYGCWEAYASATGLIREAVSRLSVSKDNKLWEKIQGNINLIEAKDVFDFAREGDAFCMSLVEYEIDYLAFGMATLINSMNPEIVVIGGGISLAGDILFEGLLEKLNEYTLEVALYGVNVVPAKLGNDAGIVGAAALLMS